MTRRGFVGAVGASVLTAQGKTLKAIGVQLYTLRTVLPKAPLETLKELEAIGFTEAEVIGGSLEAIWPSLTQTKLKPVSVHLDTALFTTNQEKLPAAPAPVAPKPAAPAPTGAPVYDLRGVACPMNYVKTKLKLEMMDAGEKLEVWLDAGEPIKNVPMSLKNDGHKVLIQEALEPEASHYRILVEKVEG